MLAPSSFDRYVPIGVIQPSVASQSVCPRVCRETDMFVMPCTSTGYAKYRVDIFDINARVSNMTSQSLPRLSNGVL